MSSTIVLRQATPTQTLEFVQHVTNLTQPCLEEQVLRSFNKEKVDTVFDASRDLAVYFGLINVAENGFSTTAIGRTLINLTGKLQRDHALALLSSVEPFPSLIRVLKSKRRMSVDDIGRFLSSNFGMRWEDATQRQMGRIYAHWLDFLEIGSYSMRNVEYTLGEIKIPEALILPGMKAAISRMLYDRLAERLNTPKNIVDEPQDLLKRVDQPLGGDPDDKGERFERFVARTFWHFGFEPRTKSSFSTDPSYPYKDRYGGGDVGLFMHYPFLTDEGHKEGYIMACEAKAGANLIGSNAVRQVNDFANRLMQYKGGLFQNYIVHKVVVSRAAGFDESGVISARASGAAHIPHDSLTELLVLQMNLLKKGGNLITPFQFIQLLNRLIAELNLAPAKEYMKKIIGESID